jgi:hypothetical protein
MQKKSFKINSELYSNEVMSEAVTDFNEYWFKVSYNNEEVIIETDENVDEVFAELMNYSLSIICSD